MDLQLNIIDCRNKYLNALLAQSQHENPVVSVILPEGTQTLPNDIRLTLETYILQFDASQASIEIAVEVNKWISKPKALRLLRNTLALINQFFIDHQKVAPTSKLAILEEKQLVYVDAVSWEAC
jgi:hypothetical protein